MKRSKILADRLKEVFLDGKWVAQTNYSQILSDVNFEEATTKIKGLNTIAALVFHVNYYIDGILHYSNTNELRIKDKYSFKSPPINNENNWNSLRSTLLDTSRKFELEIRNMSDTHLALDFYKNNYSTWERNIDAMIEHAYYHLGQISLIKKLLRSSSKELFLEI